MQKNNINILLEVLRILIWNARVVFTEKEKKWIRQLDVPITVSDKFQRLLLLLEGSPYIAY